MFTGFVLYTPENQSIKARVSLFSEVTERECWPEIDDIP